MVNMTPAKVSSVQSQRIHHELLQTEVPTANLWLPVGVLAQERMAIIDQESGERFRHEGPTDGTQQLRIDFALPLFGVVECLRQHIGPQWTIVLEHRIDFLDRGQALRLFLKLPDQNVLERLLAHRHGDRLA